MTTIDQSEQTLLAKPLIMAEHGELFDCKILVLVEPLTCMTQLYPLHVHRHRFIEHNRFITINHWSKVCYNTSLQQTLLHRYTVALYHFTLCDIVAMKSCKNNISLRYCEDCTNISLIYHFNVRWSVWCFADISAINCENKAQYSSIIVCITFARYCTCMLKSTSLQSFLITVIIQFSVQGAKLLLIAQGERVLIG